MSSLRDSIGRNIGTIALTTVLTLSLGLNVYLASNGAIGSHTSPRPAPLKAGTSIAPSIPMEDADGKPVTVSFADDRRPTVLYVLAPHCGWCKRNEANMRALYNADSDKFRFIGVSIDDHDLKKYVDDKREPFPVYLLKSKDIGKQLHVAGTPETIIVTPGAQVIHSWEGVYVEKNQAEVESYFGIKLPGLPQTAQLEAH